uniref:Calpain small subunit 1-like n=1 Tax=Sinocyclocheilus rhinocerous TaxID=307959 RepID=A0A673NNQ3_9TELE
MWSAISTPANLCLQILPHPADHWLMLRPMSLRKRSSSAECSSSSLAMLVFDEQVFIYTQIRTINTGYHTHFLWFQDMEVSPNELMNILNKIISKHGDLKTDGFTIESCRSMVAVMDSDSTGKLGFHEFKHIWNNIKKWQGVYKSYDRDRSGTIGADELPAAFRAAGFPLNDQLFQMIIRRYSDENGNMDFDNYIGCLVRLDAMCRAFKTLDKDNDGTIKVNVQEWLQLTMYS